MTKHVEPTFSGHELSTKSAVEITALLKARQISSQELIDISIARIEATEPAINAMPTVCEDHARTTKIQGGPDHPDF